MNSPVYYPLSPRTVLRLTGPDRERYLNGQVTQDVRLATEDQAAFSCVLNAKGQLDAVCHIRVHDGSYLLDAPLALREALLARLERYIIADDVELSDESERWHVAHLMHGQPPENTLAWRTTRLGQPGFDLLSPEPIKLEGCQCGSLAQFESRRIVSGVPGWGTELTPGLLPPEARLDQNAISYEKGCYLGQEVISRMKRAGKTNRHLVRLLVPAGTKIGSAIFHEDAEAGHITSVEPSELNPGDTISALGFRKRKFADFDSFALDGGAGSATAGVAIVQPWDLLDVGQD